MPDAWNLLMKLMKKKAIADTNLHAEPPNEELFTGRRCGSDSEGAYRCKTE
jgi:hypothetical protein